MQDVTQDDILKKLDEAPLQSSTKSVHGGVLVNTEDIDDYGLFFYSSVPFVNTYSFAYMPKENRPSACSVHLTFVELTLSWSIRP